MKQGGSIANATGSHLERFIEDILRGEKYVFVNDIIPELTSFKLSDTEFVLFYQLKQSGIVRLTEFKNDKLIKVEEQLFYKDSDLWGLSVQSVNNYFVLIFIDTHHRLVLKIITANKKLSFTNIVSPLHYQKSLKANEAISKNSNASTLLDMQSQSYT